VGEDFVSACARVIVDLAGAVLDVARLLVMAPTFSGEIFLGTERDHHAARIGTGKSKRFAALYLHN
jgi:hypothetical protein